MMPKVTRVAVQVKNQIPAGAEAVAVFVTEGATRVPTNGLPAEEQRAVQRLLDAGVVTGKAKEVGLDLVEAGKGKVRRVFVVGLGKADRVTAESVRQSAGTLARAAKRQKVVRLSIVLPGDLVTPDEAGEAVVTGVKLADFEYDEYKGTASNNKGETRQERRLLELTVVGDAADLRQSVERARLIADGTNFARTIASRPGNDINPPSLAKVAQELAKEVGLGVRVLDEKEMARLGMGGILAVGSGSQATPPRMIVLEHKGRAKAKGGETLLVVGKAITFDTGGISIKPAEKMGRMIFDKSGGMAVLGLMYALAKLRVPAHVVGILSSAENHISERSYRPGDILRMYNGVTVEVTNTDAEGRLVLGDALAWGIEQYKPAAVVDLATLTGGCVVALGQTMAGVMANDDVLVAELIKAGEQVGEKMWRLPVGDDQRELIKSEPADIVNSAGRYASPLQGGAFLSYFVPRDGSVPWAHLDIAGVADTEKELPYIGKGSTGWGVRTLVEWITSRAANAR